MPHPLERLRENDKFKQLRPEDKYRLEQLLADPKTAKHVDVLLKNICVCGLCKPH